MNTQKEKNEISFSYRVFCFSHEAADYFNSMQPKELVINDIGVTINRLYEKYEKDGDQKYFMESIAKAVHDTDKASPSKGAYP